MMRGPSCDGRPSPFGRYRSACATFPARSLFRGVPAADDRCMGGLRRSRTRLGSIRNLDAHPHADEGLGILSSLPTIGDSELLVLAAEWRNTASIAEARAKALEPDSPLVIEVLACFEAVVALFDDDLAGEADYVNVDPRLTTTALKAVRDAIAAAYARPILGASAYRSLIRPWRQVFPAGGLTEPDLGPNTAAVNQVMARMPLLSARCHDEQARALYD